MKKEKVKTNFEAKDEIIDPIVSNMEKIFQPENQHLLSCFTLKPYDEENSVDMAILSSLLKSLKPKISKHDIALNASLGTYVIEEQKFKNQLKLCIAWNRCDMAEKFILNEENRERVVKKSDFVFVYYSFKILSYHFYSLVVWMSFFSKQSLAINSNF
jgi:hypothetical protein